MIKLILHIAGECVAHVPPRVHLVVAVVNYAVAFLIPSVFPVCWFSF